MRRLTALLLGAVLLAGCSSPADAPATKTTTEPSAAPSSVSLDDVSAASFSPCEEENLAGFECAFVPAPLDYENPAKGTVQVAVARVRATKERTGSLFINPGGPGASGRDFLSYALSFLSAEVKASFDIVAVDPRGTGATAGLDCRMNLDEVFALDPTPEDETELQALIDADQAFASACAAAGGETLPHLSTANTARDMDRVRRALGDTTISYLGFSYGTELGATYLALFPSHVKRFVLDGPVDVTVSLQERSLRQGEGFEVALDEFFSWCEQQRCPLSPRPAARFETLMRRLDTAPLANADDRPATNLSVGLFATAVALYSTNTYGTLATALAKAEEGDGSVLLKLYDAYMERNDDGSYGTTQYGFRAISTADDAPLTIEEQVTLLADAKRRLPRWWPLFSVQPHEDPWPPFERAAPVTFGPAPAGSTLVVAATSDPATPFIGGEALASLLASPLLVRDGADHTSYASSPCVRKKVDGFLIDGNLPQNRDRCS